MAEEKKCCCRLSESQKLQYRARAEVLKALAHPARLWMAEQLGEGDRCVCEFVDAVGVDFSTVSKHLSVLRQAGIVVSRKEGKQVVYSLKTPCLLNFMHCVEAVLESKAEAHACLLKG
jgi:ArsR family transcriptional regulator